MPEDADALDLQLPYCVPGVTAKRCRGVFWETGKLYKKEVAAELPPVSKAEYQELKKSLVALQVELQQVKEGQLQTAGEEGDAVYKVRRALRTTGAHLCRALDLDQREEAERRLNLLLATLDDIDSAALKEEKANEQAPAGFTSLSLSLGSSLKLFDAFLSELPQSPTA